MRYNTRHTNQIGSDKSRLIRILEDANIELCSVLSDIFRVTGQKILKEILAGD